MQSYLNDFSIEQLNIDSLPNEIFIFFDVCKQQGLVNNSSVDTTGFGKRPHEAWWVVKHNKKIISISGLHKLDFLGKNAWRVLVRTATLKEYRGKAGPVKRNLTHDFNWGHVLKHQIEYCKNLGGTDFYFTTNSYNKNSPSNEKTDKSVKKILVPQGYIRYIDQMNLYGNEQNIWKITKFPFD
jgi:hypothetical protein